NKKGPIAYCDGRELTGGDDHVVLRSDVFASPSTCRRVFSIALAPSIAIFGGFTTSFDAIPRYVSRKRLVFLYGRRRVPEESRWQPLAYAKCVRTCESDVKASFYRTDQGTYGTGSQTRSAVLAKCLSPVLPAFESQ